MILYEHPISPYARKVKLFLREKGIPFELRQVTPTELDSAEFVAVNPRGEIPALVDGDVAIFDSTIICEYVEERFPEPRLYPVSPAERARVRMLEDLADTTFEAVPWALLEVRFFGRASGALAEALTAQAMADLGRMLDRLERELDGREYFTGDVFGIADCALLPHVGAAAMNGLKAGEDRPRLTAWVKSAVKRDAARADREDATRALAALGQDVEGAKSRPRQYRDHRLEWMLRNGGLSIVTEGLANGTIQFSRTL